MNPYPSFAIVALLALGGCATRDALPQASQPAVPTAVVATPPQTVPPQYVTSNGAVIVPNAAQRTTVVVPNGVSGSSVAMPGTRLTGAEVRSLMTGNTAAGIAANGQPYYAYFRPNGGVEFRQANLADSGSWRVLQDGRICSTLTRINAGAEQCYALYRNGTNVDFHRPDGTRVGTFTVEAGDPQNL